MAQKQTLAARMDSLESRQRGQRITQDTLLTEQQDMKRKVNEIHHCLIGDEYTQQTNGGLINDVECLKKDVSKLKTWKTRLVAAGSVISAIFAFLAALAIKEINHFKHITPP